MSMLKNNDTKKTLKNTRKQMSFEGLKNTVRRATVGIVNSTRGNLEAPNRFTRRATMQTLKNTIRKPNPKNVNNQTSRITPQDIPNKTTVESTTDESLDLVKQKIRRSSVDSSTNVNRKDIIEAGTNIQVFLRCKGELKSTNKSCLEFVGEDPIKEVLLNNSNCIYSFDRVFKETANQKEVYEEVASPILDDVLKGCTIFAYGQTGTGKTYTMEGEVDKSDYGLGMKAGIIPRIIHNLFTKLGPDNKDDYVTLSMLELYNEELRDLLWDSDYAKPLVIYEDKEAGVKVQNMQEVPVMTVTAGLDLIKSGIERRMTAATNCNEKSSRSHSICTISVYKKYISESGTEEYRIGRLNLVDLAGSENSKSAGTTHVRKREAASINKSLLTLGRVINCLAEKSPHIPYRESKLTRLLKDSLGGKTKTCIIATVSAFEQNHEDLKNTLDYGSSAKHITNKKQTSTISNSQSCAHQMAQQLEQVYTELRNNYKRIGVHISEKKYLSMTQEIESLRQEKDQLVMARENEQKAWAAERSAERRAWEAEKAAERKARETERAAERKAWEAERLAEKKLWEDERIRLVKEHEEEQQRIKSLLKKSLKEILDQVDAPPIARKRDREDDDDNLPATKKRS